MTDQTILYVLHREEPSETFIRREIDGLRQAGLRLAIHTLEPASGEATPTRALRRAVGRAMLLRLLRPPFSLSYAIRLTRGLPYAARLVAAARQYGGAHLHAQFAWKAADAAALAAAVLRGRWSCGVHAWDIFTRPRRETRARLATASGVTACTQRAADAVRNAGIARDKIALIRHGLDMPALRFAANRPDNHIVAIGRLVAKKGFDTLLKACATLRHNGTDFRCTFVGDGPEAAKLRGLADTLQIADAITWTGWRPAHDAQRIIASATVLAHPSRRLANADADGFANVLSEAMFLGTPIVTTEAGAAGELLKENANALIVPPDDVAALSQALGQLLAQPHLCQRLAQAARITAELHLDQAKTTPQLIDFFKTILTPAHNHENHHTSR